MDASDRANEHDEFAGDAPAPRERLAPELVARVLAAFGLEGPARIRAVELGSRRAPKVVVEIGQARYFLKRRRPGPVEGARFTAGLQRRLAVGGSPVPRVHSTIGGEAVHECDGHVYELVDFVVGERYPRRASSAASAGRTLVRLHEEMRNLAAPERLRGSYHDSPLVREVLGRLRERGDGLALDPESLSDRYERAAEQVRPWIAGRSPRLVHGDFHPGNLIHAADEEGRVLAVLDWEAVRLDMPQAEFAAAAVHFAMPPSSAPTRASGLDESLLQAFAGGYGPFQRDTAEVLPALMIEAVVAETAFLLDGGVRGVQAASLAGTVDGLLTWIDRERSGISRIVSIDPPR